MAVPVHSVARVPFGATGASVSRLGLGCMGLTSFYGTKPSTEASLALIGTALDLGINLFDTADAYGPPHGVNEELLGQAVAKFGRERFFLCTKFGFGASGFCAAPSYVKEACDASLKRLGVDCIDLFYSHRVDPKVPVEDTVAALKELVDAGKVRHIGLCEASAAALRRAAAVHPIAALQTEWSPFVRDLETEILPAARELGVAVVAYSPLGRGLLGMNSAADIAALPPDDWRRGLPWWSPENAGRTLKVVGRFRSVAARKQVGPGQLALAWLLAQGKDVFAIPGTTRVDRLRENAAACQVEVSPADASEIEPLAGEMRQIGARYMDGAMEMCDEDSPPKPD